MEEDRGARKIFKGQGQIKSKRPVKIWLDEVEKDLKILKVCNWKQKTIDRSLWREIVGEAIVQHGLWSQGVIYLE